MSGDHGFRRLFAGETVSGFGDWFTYIGVSAVAVGQPHRELALVAVCAATLPRVLLAPIAGVLADRVDRRTLLCAATIGRGACAAAMAASAAAGWLWAVHAWHLARMALGAITDASSRAMLPRLVPPARLASANAWMGLAWNATFVAGIAAGGATTAIAGAGAAFAVDALTFGVAAAVFAGLPRISIRRAATAAVPRDARGAMLAKVPVAIATGAGWIALAEAAGDASRVAVALGTMHVVRAIGAGVAPLVWPRTIRGLHVATALAIGSVACFGDHAALVWAATWGAGVGASWVTATTLLQARVPDGALGRASAIDITAQTLAQAAGGILAAAIVAAGGTGAQACGAGAAVAVLAWVAIARGPR